jgi:membrane protein DedA with SNARE-associated domain
MIAASDVLSYAILFAGVAASWIGIPIVGGAVLATAAVLANNGQLNVWVVVVIAAVAAWMGGYVGYLLGRRAGDALAGRPGRWQRQRRRAVQVGERFYRRWGRLALFLTPTWVTGALRMPRSSFLRWNALAAIVSSLVTVFGAYAVARALVGQLSAWPSIAALALVITTAVAGFALYRRRVRSRTVESRAG